MPNRARATLSTSVPGPLDDAVELAPEERNLACPRGICGRREQSGEQSLADRLEWRIATSRAIDLAGQAIDSGISAGIRGFLDEATQRQRIGGKLVEYGYMFWPVPDADGAYGDGAYAAIGIFGQYLYVNPAKSLVVAMWGAQSKPAGTWVVDDYDFFAALSQRLD